MTNERYREADQTGQLTEAEVAEGWHFCYELDFALVNHVGAPNTEWCKCLEKEKAKEE
jgi:hypothetical protein